MPDRAFVVAILARQGVTLPDEDVDFLTRQLAPLERMAARLRPVPPSDTPAHWEPA